MNAMTFDPYASVKPYFLAGNSPAYAVSDEDKARLQSYDFYDNAYWNMPNNFKVMQRGFDASPIYLPSPRKMVEAVNRFLAVKFNYILEGADESLTALVVSLFKRESFFTKFTTQKRYGLVRGDGLWHMVGDDTAEAGSRLSIYELDPRNYFPIWDPDNREKRIGCHLVDVIIDPGDANGTKQVARVQTYRKEDRGGRTVISSELNLFEVAGWDDRNLPAKDIKFIRNLKPKFDLPPEITSLPVYGVPNNRIPGPSLFHYSEVLGIERIFAALNQAISDEELSLAMAGLGIFWTTSGPPVDGGGNPTAWDIGPARMIEIGMGSAIGRLGGITSVDPMIDHMRFMLGEAQSGLGIGDVATGSVDVQIAESGIALQLQLSPLLAHNAEKESALIESYDRLFYDLIHAWIPAYEGGGTNDDVVMESVVGDPMPRNRKADIGEVMDLVNSGILSLEEAREILIAQFGYKIQASVDKLLAEKAARSSAEDPFADRSNGELDDGDGDSGAAGQQNNSNGFPIATVTT